MNYFTLKEQACKCCGEGELQPDLLECLNNAREYADIPFTLSSAVRCESHNKAVGGVKNSSHVDGWAVDIEINNSMERFAILQALIVIGFNRIGISDNFIHVDCDPNKPSCVSWTY